MKFLIITGLALFVVILAIASTSASLIGTITTIAGTGTPCYACTGCCDYTGPAGSARLSSGGSIAVDPQGIVYISDVSMIKKLTLDNTGSYSVSIIAGRADSVCLKPTDTCGDGGDAKLAGLWSPQYISIDTKGNFYIIDNYNIVDVGRLRKLTPDGSGYKISTVSITGNPKQLYGLATDSSDNVYVADSGNGRILKIDPTGSVIKTFGKGTCLTNPNQCGDGGPADQALIIPYGITVDKTGNIYLVEFNNNRIRKIFSQDLDTNGDGTPEFKKDYIYTISNSLSLSNLHSAAVDSSGNLYTFGYAKAIMLTPDKTGNYIITTIAGTGQQGYSGEGGPAISAQLNYPQNLAVDSEKNIYITEQYRIRKITGPLPTPVTSSPSPFPSPKLSPSPSPSPKQSPSPIISPSPSPKQSPSPTPPIVSPSPSPKLSPSPSPTPIPSCEWRLFCSGDRWNCVSTSDPLPLCPVQPGTSIPPKPITSCGLDKITNKCVGYLPSPSPTPKPEPVDLLGNNGPAVSAKLYLPYDVSVDRLGNVYIADTFNNMVRKVDLLTKTITAISSKFSRPSGIYVKENSLYIADAGNNVVKRMGIALPPIMGGGSGLPISGG